MYVFNRLQLSNYLLWNDLNFEFEKGLTYVNGENGSGKSLFVSALSPMFYNIDNIPDNSRATLDFSNDEHDYSFTVFNHKGKKNKFEVVIDGKSQKTETINAGRNLIEAHFCQNIQQSLFDTTVSIGTSEHPLSAKGTKASQRLDWVHETLAYASVLDSYLEDVERKLKSTRDDSVRFNLLKTQLNNLESVDKPETNINELKSEIRDLSNKIKDLEEKQRLLEQALNTDYAPASDKPELTLEEAENKLIKTKSALKNYNELRILSKTYEDKLEEYREANKAYLKASYAYSTLCELYGKKEIAPKTAVDTTENVLEKLNKQIKEAQHSNGKYEEQTEDRELAQTDRKVLFDNKKDYINRINALKERIAINSSQLRFAKGDEENCPVCGSSKTHIHEPKAIEEQVDKFKKQLKKVEYDYSVWVARQIDFVEYIDVEKLEKRKKQVEKLRVSAQAVIDCRSAIPNEPEKPDYNEEDHSKIRFRIKKLEDLVIEIKSYEKSKKIAKIDNPYLQDSKETNSKLLETVEVNLIKIYKKQKMLQDEIITSQTQLALHNKYRTDRSSLIEAAKPLKQANSDNRLLQITRKALGRDGFRAKRLESTLELFVHNLNEFAPLLWNKPFKFDIEVGKRKCDIIAHRNNKTGTITSLSGAEKGFWKALCALSMLRLLPSNRRCDLIVLDELEANMDKIRRDRLISEFLPELGKTVDKVLYISPIGKQELGIKPDQGYLVNLKGGKSRLTTM